MFRNLLGGRRTAHTQLLAAFVRLSPRSTDGDSLVFMPQYGSISCLGFARGYGSEVFRCAPLAEPAAQGQFYRDKSIRIQARDERSYLGSAEIKEAYVYDTYYHSEIDFTGLELALTLQQSALEDYERFVGNAIVPTLGADPEAWHGDLLVLIPAPVFEFPTGRGSAPPYPPARTREAKVGRLHMIKNFRFDAIDVVKIRARDRPGAFHVPDILNFQPEHVLRLC